MAMCVILKYTWFKRQDQDKNVNAEIRWNDCNKKIWLSQMAINKIPKSSNNRDPFPLVLNPNMFCPQCIRGSEQRWKQRVDILSVGLQ